MTSQPHDALFRAVFSQQDLAASELRALLPVDVGEALDWSSLEVMPGTYIDGRLKRRQSDLLYRVGFHGSEKPALIYVLQEHQSRADPEMPFRLLRYLVRIWEGFRKDHPQSALPPIVPVVVSHSEGGWGAPQSFERMVDFHGMQEALLPHTPRFSYILLDLAKVSDEELNQRFEAFIALIFRALRDARRLGVLAFVMRELATFRDLGRSQRKEALLLLYRYLLVLTSALDKPSIIKLVSDNEPIESEGMMYSAAQSLIDEGIERGIEKGIEKGIERGIEKGRVEGETDMLRRQLRLKFPKASRQELAPLDNATSEQLRAWSERFVTANTIDEVFAL